MREHLFRGKRVRADEDGVFQWVFGYFLLDSTLNNPAQIIDSEGRWFDVDPDTVGEFAGWKGKNGVKIFEGDIVSYNGTVHKVVFENRGYSGYFGIVMGNNETWPFGMSVPPNMMDVIGNVHDNPELLTQ